jgi:hypothetical protein
VAWSEMWEDIFEWVIGYEGKEGWSIFKVLFRQQWVRRATGLLSKNNKVETGRMCVGLHFTSEETNKLPRVTVIKVKNYSRWKETESYDNQT